MEKILNFVAYCVILIVAFPVTVVELIFKAVTFVTLCSVFLIMMFFAPLFKNITWPKSVEKFFDYVLSLNFIMTSKLINAYKDALNLR